MLVRFSRMWTVIGLVLALWGLAAIHHAGEYALVRPLGTPAGPVRILRFYASVGSLTVGDKAQLCYGVENARSVRISPMLTGVYPSPNHCLEIGPQRTTHYTIQAEGFDGAVATQSFTLAVQAPIEPRQPVNYAAI